MSRVNVLLVFLLLVCALGLVTSQHHARRLFIDLERAQGQARQLESRWDQLRVEQDGLAKPSMIDGKARRGLSMQAVPANRTLYLTADVPVEQTAMKADK